MKAYKFIGGAYHNEYIKVPTNRGVPMKYYELPASHQSPCLAEMMVNAIQRIPIKNITYRREQFIGQKKQFYLYVEESMSIDEALTMLLEDRERLNDLGT